MWKLHSRSQGRPLFTAAGAFYNKQACSVLTEFSYNEKFGNSQIQIATTHVKHNKHAEFRKRDSCRRTDSVMAKLAFQNSTPEFAADKF
jgi:hypothetical protein